MLAAAEVSAFNVVFGVQTSVFNESVTWGGSRGNFMTPGVESGDPPSAPVLQPHRPEITLL